MAASKKKKPQKKQQKKTSSKKTATKAVSKDGLSSLGIAMILGICGILFLLLFFCVSPAADISGAGVLLQYIVKIFVTLFGVTRYVLPFYLFLLAFAFFRKGQDHFRFVRFVIFSSLLFITFPSFFCIDQSFIDFKGFMTVASGGEGGGVFGGIFAYLLLLLFSEPVSVVILILLAFVSVLMLVNFSLLDYLRKKQDDLGEKIAEKKEAARLAKEAAEAEAMAAEEAEVEISPEPTVSDKKKPMPKPGKKKRKVVEYAGHNRIIIDGMIFTKDMPCDDFDGVTFRERMTGKTEVDDLVPLYDDSVKDPDMGLVAGLQGGYGTEDIKTEIFTAEDLAVPGFDEEEPVVDAAESSALEEKKAKKGKKSKEAAAVFEDVISPAESVSEPPQKVESKKKSADEDEAFDVEAKETSASRPLFSPPKTSILEKGERSDKKKTAQNIREGVAKLEKTLASFGVQARVTEVSCGPSLIRYEVQPGPGVKVSKIVNLTDDIALQLAAANVRMEAPIPGKSVIGIEVPRKDTVTVYFRDILENSRFFDMPSKLTCAYGQDIAGNPVIGDLASMPHLLIAGTTGSGKSVCMNTMICSILFKATPDEVKFIMIDPKQVEFVIYEGLPHLITPVVTDPKKAAGALKWALREMENRYTLFNQNRVRNLEGYNKLVENPCDKLPQIVIFIDELADLMMVAAKDVEASICRLAQKARAAGIHLVIATQRPSVDVITGLIKANIPSRIALSVSSQTDSRTILDVGGAEKLLGRGDMLYMPIGYSKPLRVQGAWLSDADAAAILDHYKKQGSPDYIDGVAQAVETGDKNDKESFAGDPLFFDAARAAITAGQASTSMMQRRFRIGYNHAARLMEELEEKGVVGPADGARPRTVLMSLEVFKDQFKEPEEQSLFEE